MAPLTTSFGYLLVTAYLTLALYGIVFTLCLRYFHSFPKDSIYVKLHVAILMILSTAHALTLMWFIYESLITRFSEPAYKLNDFPLSAPINLYILLTLILVAQCFFIDRIRILSKSIWMTVPSLVFALVTYGIGLHAVAQVQIAGKYSAIFSVTRYTTVADVLALLCDSIVTLQLCYLLHRSRTQIPATNNLINKILVNILHRGGYNLILAVALMITLRVSPRTTLFVLPFDTAGQIMTITVYTTLLSRQSIRQKYDLDVHYCFSSITDGASVLARSNDNTLESIETRSTRREGPES